VFPRSSGVYGSVFPYPDREARGPPQRCYLSDCLNPNRLPAPKTKRPPAQKFNCNVERPLSISKHIELSSGPGPTIWPDFAPLRVSLIRYSLELTCSHYVVCEECELLGPLSTLLSEENMDVLDRYHQAVFSRDWGNMELIRDAIAGRNCFGSRALENLENHRHAWRHCMAASGQ